MLITVSRSLSVAVNEERERERDELFKFLLSHFLFELKSPHWHLVATTRNDTNNHLYLHKKHKDEDKDGCSHTRYEWNKASTVAADYFCI